jgi:hypothetical protein
MADNLLSEGNLADVGNTLKLRNDIDPEGRGTTFIRSSLSVIDIIPCTYCLSLAGLTQTEWGIKYDFESAISKYEDICANYGLTKKKGIRLWVTDDTVASDEIGNFYDKNQFETAINNFSGKLQIFDKVKGYMESTSAGLSEASIDTLIKTFKLDSVFPKTTITKSLSDIVLLGKKVGLPKVWGSSSYNPSLTVTVKLVSPYGNSKAINNYIIKPLTYILLLASPQSSDGISYGLPLPVRVQAYGMSYMSLASIDSVNIRRGGREVAHNIFKQPLAIDVYLTLKPLIEGFGAMTGKPDMVTVNEGNSPFDTPPTSGPGITTVGTIIQSFRPAPTVITAKLYSSYNFALAPGSKKSSGNISIPSTPSNVNNAISGI